jgi:hypothetical protein
MRPCFAKWPWFAGLLIVITLGKPPSVMAQSGASLPFDFRSQAAHGMTFRHEDSSNVAQLKLYGSAFDFHWADKYPAPHHHELTFSGTFSISGDRLSLHPSTSNYPEANFVLQPNKTTEPGQFSLINLAAPNQYGLQGPVH